MFARRTSQGILQHLVGYSAIFAEPTAYVALFTTAPTDNTGTGAVEVAGGSYARVQTTQGTSGTWGTASNTDPTTLSNAQAITFPTATNIAAPSAPTLSTQTTGGNGSLAASTAYYVVITAVSAGGETTPSTSATVTTGAGTTNQITVTLPALATGETGANVYAGTSSSGPFYKQNTALVTGTSFIFGTSTNPFQSSGTQPPNTNSASWGTVTSFGLYDAATSGNLLAWDWLGNYQWLPCTISSASPGVITAHAHGYSAGDNAVFTTVFGGTAPTFSQSNLTGLLAVANPTTDTFTVTNSGTAVNTSATGDGMVRKVVTQSVPAGVQPSFAAGALVLYGD